jgi:hypothetical protein
MVSRYEVCNVWMLACTMGCRPMNGVGCLYLLQIRCIMMGFKAIISQKKRTSDYGVMLMNKNTKLNNCILMEKTLLGSWVSIMQNHYYYDKGPNDPAPTRP